MHSQATRLCWICSECLAAQENLGPRVTSNERSATTQAIGINAAMLGVRFLKEVANESHVIDPFCGMVSYASALNPNPKPKTRNPRP